MKICWASSGAGRRREALLPALLALVVLLCLAGFAAPSPGPPDPPAPPGTPEQEPADGPGDDVVLALTDIRPAILRPGDDLVVEGTVTNDTTTQIAEPELRLRAQQSTPNSRSLLARWLDPASLSATTLLHAERLTDPVDPGATVAFTLTVPAEELPLAETSTAWGPRGIEVTVHDAAAPTVESPAEARSFLLWWPDIEVLPMPLAVLGAAVATAPERAAAHESGASLAQVSAQRLSPLVAALDRPDVDLAADPSLLVDVPRPSDVAADPESAGGPAEEAPPSAAVEELREALAAFAADPERTLHALPWADADAAALAHSGRLDLLSAAGQQRDVALADAGYVPSSVHDTPDTDTPTATTDLGWPAAATPDAATVHALAGSGGAAVVLPSGALRTIAPLTYTPSGRAELEAGDGQQVAGLLTDERLSALLAGSLLPVGATQGTAVAELDALTARQYLLAETAVVARERPADQRPLLLTVPRDFAGDPELLDARLAALADAPWLDRVQVADLVSSDAPDVERAVLPRLVVEDGEVDAQELARVSEVLEDTADFAGVLTDPASLVAPARASLLGVTSAAWRELPELRTELVEAAEDTADSIQGLVAARPGSTLNLINNEAHLPVAVTNELSQSAHVVVQLSPRDPRLAAEEEVALEIPAQQSATAQIPVRAVGSGDVVVDVLLTAPDGAPIDEPTEIRVRVRADWETVGTAVLAGILAVVLVVGIVRTVRRGGRRGARPQVAP